jgi:hypothetical protein
VSALRLRRFSPDAAAAAAAAAAFGRWHVVSLLLSFVTIALSGAALALAAKLPADTPAPPATAEEMPG